MVLRNFGTMVLRNFGTIIKELLFIWSKERIDKSNVKRISSHRRAGGRYV